MTKTPDLRTEPGEAICSPHVQDCTQVSKTSTHPSIDQPPPEASSHSIAALFQKP